MCLAGVKSASPVVAALTDWSADSASQTESLLNLGFHCTYHYNHVVIVVRCYIASVPESFGVVYRLARSEFLQALATAGMSSLKRPLSVSWPGLVPVPVVLGLPSASCRASFHTLPHSLLKLHTWQQKELYLCQLRS